MRIVVVLSSLYTGGAEYSTLTFYGWLRRQGHDVMLICAKIASPSYEPAQFGLDQAVILEGNSFLKKLQHFRLLVREFKPNIVHSVLFQANMLGRMCRLLSRNFIHVESLVNEMYSPHRLADPQVTRTKLLGYRLIDFVTQLWGVDRFQANGVSVAHHYQQVLTINPNRIT